MWKYRIVPKFSRSNPFYVIERKKPFEGRDESGLSDEHYWHEAPCRRCVSVEDGKNLIHALIKIDGQEEEFYKKNRPVEYP